VAINFDDDSVGAVLEYTELIGKTDSSYRTRQNSWENQNVKEGDKIIWQACPAISRATITHHISFGRSKENVSKRIERIFLDLERAHIFDRYPGDDSPTTPYRVLSPLGEDLLHEGSYLEYLHGASYIANRWKGSVVKLHREGEAGIGTGFIIRPDMIATAKHVVQELGRFVIEASDGQILEHGDPILASTFEDLDLALVPLHTSYDKHPPLRICEYYDLLDQVVIFGYPPVPLSDGSYLIVNRGEVSSIIRPMKKDIDLILLSAFLRGGHSGGPVLNRRGQVIGVVSNNFFKQLTGEESINEALAFSCAIPACWLNSLIQDEL